jgi:hypothetical protein
VCSFSYHYHQPVTVGYQWFKCMPGSNRYTHRFSIGRYLDEQQYRGGYY